MAAKKPKKPSASKPKPTASKSPSKPASSKTAASKAASSKTTSSKAAVPKGKRKPPPDIPGQIDGLRGWVDQIERKQNRMTWIAAAGLLVALAAAGVALYFGITTHNDAATEGDLNGVRNELSTLSGEVDAANKGKKSVGQQITALQSQVQGLESRNQQLTQQISSLRQQGGAASPAIPGATPTAPTPAQP